MKLCWKCLLSVALFMGICIGIAWIMGRMARGKSDTAKGTSADRQMEWKAGTNEVEPVCFIHFRRGDHSWQVDKHPYPQHEFSQAPAALVDGSWRTFFIVEDSALSKYIQFPTASESGQLGSGYEYVCGGPQ